MKRIFTSLTALALAAFASVANAQVTLTDIGTGAMAPGSNDVFEIIQTDDGLNYYDDNSTPPGQTFTTGSNAGGYTLTNLTLKTAGNGGAGETGSQTYTLSLYSVAGTTATLITTYTGTLALVQNDWINWSGLNVPLAANTQYAYTFNDTTGWEELADEPGDPCSGGQICVIPTGGGTITFGTTGKYDAAFDAGLALGSVATGTAALTQSATAPTPGANDISQLASIASSVPAQNDDGLNYYDNNSSWPGQTFLTGNSPVGYVMTSLQIKTAGGGGSSAWSTSQPYNLYIYSVSASGNATPIATNSVSGFTFSQNHWLQWTGLNVPLAANTEYAYSFAEVNNIGWEHIANYTGHPYANGAICCIAAGGGTINYGTTANTSDAAFDVGLVIPQIPVPATPTYTPNVATIYAGSVLTLNETATGPAPLYYQWQTDGGSGGSLTNIPGAAGTNLVVDTTSFTAGGTYNYQVIVTNKFGSATSSELALNIIAGSAPTLVTDTTLTPDTATNFVGLSETFTADIEGTLPIAYQWQVSPDGQESDAVNIPGATNQTLVLNNLQVTNTGYYSLLATNAVSPFTLNSTWTQLTVVPAADEVFTWSAPVPFGGLSAGQILSNPAGNYLEAAYFGPASGPIPVTINGKLFNFFGDGSKASVSGNQGTSSGAWLQGANTTGNANFDTVLNQFAYDNYGGTIHTITLHNLLVGSNYSVQVFALDDRGAGAGRVIDFQDPNNAADVSATYAEQANAYLIGTFTANSTDVALQENLLQEAGNIGEGNVGVVVVRALNYKPSAQPAIVTQPSSATAYVGRTAQFSILADGIPVPTYQWQVGPVGGPYTNLVNGGQISGATNATLVVANVSLANSLSEFVVNVTNSAGYIQSSAADLTVLPAPPVSGAYAASVLALKPVAYWPFDETNDPSAGGAAVYDASGNQRDGVYLPAAQNVFDGIVGPQPADGYSQFAAGQGALETTGAETNSWALTPALNLNTNTVTITLWLNPNGSQGDYTGLFMDRNTGDEEGMNYTLNQSLGYTWNDNDSGTWKYVSGPVIPQNIWSFVALVITPTNASFYVINTNNGVTSTSYAYVHTNAAWGGAVTPDPLIRIGSDNTWQTRTFNGVIDEVAVFNYALAAGQLEGLTGVGIVNTNAATANFAATVTGGAGSQTFNFTWDPGHLGWQLYTNSVGLTAAGSWFPVPGSSSVTNESLTLDPTQTNVFFQLRYP